MNGDSVNGPRGLGWVLGLASAHRGRIVLAAAAGVAGAAAAIGLTATAAWLISRAAEQPPVLYLMVAIVAVRAFGVGRGALRYAERLASHDAAFRILADLRLGAFARLRALAPSGLAEDRTGDLLSRLVADVDGLADLWLRVVLPYAVAALVGLGTVLLVAAILPTAGLVLAASLLLAAVAAPMAGAAVARRAESSLASTRGALASGALELLRGAPELLVAQAHEARLRALAVLDRRLRDAEARSSVGSGLGTLVAELAQGAAVWLALVVGVGAVRGGSLGGVALAVVVLTPIAAHELVVGLGPAAQQLPRLRSAAARVGDVLSRADPVHEPVSPRVMPPGPYGLRLRAVRARYTTSVTDVLHGVDLDLLPGQRALVTGASGSGKSTLAALLLRFLDPSAGTIELITGHGTVALDALDGDAVRRIIGLCAQDPYIFDTSLRENLRLARPDADDAQLVKALETARLGAWLASLPDGLDTLVGAHGTRLSGGQRQRIELARTVLGNRPIVVFDEPTEHLDERSAAALTADLLRATSGRTTIFITHRPGLMAALQPAATIDLGRSSGEPAGSAVARPPAVTLAEADVLAAVPAPIVARAPRR